ncbi:tetratricopeptide repeat protein [Brevundimonas goettingensis]|uniref:Ancillary SecYEG translocon subunit n=1 Tax=Brevundimonas goettingensis TaxID=2774190 RepID=A0A975C3T4_9CAUL|nr:tetratricopeptide repeat protein [Brevundimonas goettingensis]QTC92960.1 tetratricopeptide repeat protein [Brevundimonas goettingensis]
MVDVFEQVEEELRSDRYKRLFLTWGPIVGGILLLALIGALGWWGWDSWQNSKADKASVAYDRGLEALQQGNAAGAGAAFLEAQKEGNGAYKALALQQRAGLAVQANNLTQAVELFDEAAKAAGDPILKDTAAYKAALIILDTGTTEDAIKRLTPLAAEGRPMRPFAQEALAMANLQAGKPADARVLCVQLTLGQDVPDSVRQMAQQCIDAVDTGAAANVNDIIKAQKALPPVTAPSAQALAGAQPQTAAPAAAQ